MDHRDKLVNIYKTLLTSYGNRHWWPAETPFEMMIGAILTQNVSWSNASLAVSALKRSSLLSPEALATVPHAALAPLLKPSRFMNLKAQRLKNYVNWYISEFNADLSRMAYVETWELRERLLEVNGIGKETADSILLYACNKPIFVVDSYSFRIFTRLGLITDLTTYDELQDFFMRNLPMDVKLYGDYHAQIVHLGNKTCKKEPYCAECPLKKHCALDYKQ